ncbi:hypothetical protein [Abyssalbus ytuae]|uniref:Uncharacterized protein n=1 Tax=Abyssalbus ytuae TaxID=2926907 RepID=A0A9E7A0D5_9FLAO|nr:hypothetical protein [Abyssalbus ytuae]UOB18547.1 hypothetical protein MQE35_04480 [Abyssalbus ytuae]
MNKEYTLDEKLNASATVGPHTGRFLSGYLSYILSFFIIFFLNKLITVGLYVVNYSICIFKKMFFVESCSESTSVEEPFSMGMSHYNHGHNTVHEVTISSVKNQNAVSAPGSKTNSRLNFLTSYKSPTSFNYPGVSLSTISFSIFQS